MLLHAAKWRGCTVAVKVLSHEGSKSAQVNALHEEVVSQHVSHPNVVRLHLCPMHAWCKGSARLAHE